MESLAQRAGIECVFSEECTGGVCGLGDGAWRGGEEGGIRAGAGHSAPLANTALCPTGRAGGPNETYLRRRMRSEADFAARFISERERTPGPEASTCSERMSALAVITQRRLFSA